MEYGKAYYGSGPYTYSTPYTYSMSQEGRWDDTSDGYRQYSAPLPREDYVQTILKFNADYVLQDSSPTPTRSGQIVESIGNDYLAAPPFSSDYTIYRVPESLRSIKEEAYTPMSVSIGPFHHKNDKLSHEKLRSLHLMLQRDDQLVLEEYVDLFLSLEERLGNCYSETLSYSKNELVKMMLLDSCFILELMFQYWYLDLRAKTNPIFKNHCIFNAIHRDLLLLENQLPLFALEEVFDWKNKLYPRGNFREITKHFLGYYPSIPLLDINYESEHLIGVVLYNFTSRWGRRCPLSKPNKNTHVFIPSATELHQVGVEFASSSRLEEGTELLAAHFSKEGMITLPSLVVDHRTEALFRNLLAFEQIHKSAITSHADYDASTTILTSADVALLCDQGIIHNHLGEYEEVAQVFNSLCSGIVTLTNNFHFSCLFQVVNDYHDHHLHDRRSEWSRTIEAMKREYLKSPWAWISLFAAVFMFVCTGIQTYSALQQIIHF